jgi:AraC-like DNA-binding protein
MPCTSAVSRGNLDPLVSGKEVILLNGHPAIHSFACNSGQASAIFLEGSRLLFVRRGSCLLRYGVKQWELRSNEMALLKPAISIDFCTGIGAHDLSDNEYLFFDFNSELLQDFVRLGDWKAVAGGDFSAVITGAADQKLQAYVQSLDSYFNDPGKCSDNLIRVKLLELLFFLAGAAPTLFHQLVHSRLTSRPDLRATVEENIMSGLSLYELAALARRSLSSFRRDFHAVYNMPPSQWIRQKRMENAGKLLTNTSMSVAEICYSLGFQNVTNFCRIFKSHFGHPALKFRSNTIHSTRITHQ